MVSSVSRMELDNASISVNHIYQPNHAASVDPLRLGAHRWSRRIAIPESSTDTGNSLSGLNPAELTRVQLGSRTIGTQNHELLQITTVAADVALDGTVGAGNAVNLWLVYKYSFGGGALSSEQPVGFYSYSTGSYQDSLNDNFHNVSATVSHFGLRGEQAEVTFYLYWDEVVS